MSAHQSQIAPAAPLRSVAKAARLCSSLGRAATIIHDQMAVRSRGWGVPQCCVLPPARGQGRGHVAAAGRNPRYWVFCLLHDVPPVDLAGAFNSSGPFRQFVSSGGCSCVPALLNQHRRQRAFQGIRQCRPSHFSKPPVRYVPTRNEEAFQNAGNISQQGL